MKIYLYRVIHKMSTNPWIVAIKNGLLKVQPLILIVCLIQILLYIATIVTNNNFVYYEDVIKCIEFIYKIIRIMLVITISYSLASNNYKDNKDLKPIASVSTALMAVAILTSYSNNIKEERFLYFINSLILIIFALLSTELFIYFYRVQRKYLKSTMNYYEKITNNFNFIILPTIITIIICIFIKYIFIDKIIISLARSVYSGITGVYVDIILGQMLWFLGGHGGNIIYDNSSSLSLIRFSNLGGAGSTLSLILAIYILKKNKEKKRVGKIAIIASIFNINEPILYGLPILFNPIYLIPFIVVPLVSVFITTTAYKLGFINLCIDKYQGVMPVFFNGYIISGSFKGVIIQVINLVIGILIYIPFIKISNKITEIELRNNFEELKDIVFSNNVGTEKLIEREDEIGNIAKILASDLYNALINNKELYLEYQPQVSKNRSVVGVEALLRWSHGTLGNIPPNIIILLAIELEIINDLGKWIIEESCSQLGLLKKEVDRNIEMSINVASQQLTDKTLYNFMVDVVNKYDVDFNNIKIEITETEPLGNDNMTKEQIRKLNSLGIKFAIDDFGQGYNPILYLKKYNIDTIKLDGKLIKDIHTDKESRYIVESMFNLCKNLDMKIVCEFVEKEEQKLILDNMGDGIYQGYLFSKPLGRVEVIEFIKEN